MATEIDATLCYLTSDLNRRFRRNYYECTGPDGARFTNTNKADLIDALRHRYGKVNLHVIDNR